MPAADQRPENELRAEAYLSRVSALQSELTCQLQHLRALRAHGRAASGAQDVLTPLRLRQVQRRVEQLRADLSRAQREVAWAVGRLPNPRARTLMEMRYLSCLTWDEIAQALYASPRAAQASARVAAGGYPAGRARGLPLKGWAHFFATISARGDLTAERK